MMGYRIIPISELSAKQVMSIVQIHMLVIDSLLSELGPLVVERYYQIACADESVIGCCAISQSGYPLGWVIGSPAPSQLNERVRTALGPLSLLRTLIVRPRLIWQIFISSRSSSVQLKPGALELTYIGVHTSTRKQGLGLELLIAFLAQVQTRGYQSVVLSVEAENTAALTLYQRAGFQRVNSFREGRYNRLRMELNF